MNLLEIKTIAVAYADRGSDVDLPALLPSMISIVESRINTELLSRESTMVAYTPLVTDEVYYDLPSDFLHERGIKIANDVLSTGKSTLQYLAPEQMDAESDFKCINAYTIVGNKIQVSIALANTNNVLEIIYYRKVTPLLTNTETNWLSTLNPEAYIFGLVAEIYAYAKDEQGYSLWDARFLSQLEKIGLRDDKAAWSGTTLRMRNV